MFLGGVVAIGETYGEAARREVAEELGIQGVAPEFLFAHLYEGERNFSWIQLYRVTWDGPIVHQAEEVAWGEWMPEAELEAWSRRVPIVDDGLDVFHH